MRACKRALVVLAIITGVVGDEGETIYGAVQRLSPGPGSTAAKLWARYLPHLVTSQMLGNTHAPGDFVTQARSLARTLGFNASSVRCAYEGPGSHKHPGPLFTSGEWWQDGNNYIMQQTPPNVRSAHLIRATIENIDPERNLLCPCFVGTCIDAGATLPDFCVPVLANSESTTSYGDLEDELLINLAVLTIIIGLIMVLIAG